MHSRKHCLHAQQEAIRRVREMQARARHTLESAGVRLEPTPPPRVQPTSEHTAYIAPETHPQTERPFPQPIQHRNEPIREKTAQKPQTQIEDLLYAVILEFVVVIDSILAAFIAAA